MGLVGSPSRCLNCGEALHGAFCSHCGQRALPPHPTIHELVGDAYDELVGWDGKFAATLRTLLTKPGALTRDFLEGRRVRYLPPVKLYLMCSVVYFVVAALLPPVADPQKLEVSAGVGFGVDSGEQSPGEAALAKAVASGPAALTPQERADLESEIDSQPLFLRPVVRALAEDAAGLQRRGLEIMPRALFLLIPALAGILAFFYRGRRYPDHLYFALHLQTFAFVVLTLSTPFQYGTSLWVIGGAQMAAVMWILVYAILAQRRVYGGTWLRTLLKSACAAAIYGVLWTAVSLVVTLWVSRQG